MITLNRWKDDNTNDSTNSVSKINGKNNGKNKEKNKGKKGKKIMNKKALKIGYHVLFLCGHQFVVFF